MHPSVPEFPEGDKRAMVKKAGISLLLYFAMVCKLLSGQFFAVGQVLLAAFIRQERNEEVDDAQDVFLFELFHGLTLGEDVRIQHP